jgi:hypothetical protein
MNDLEKVVLAYAIADKDLKAARAAIKPGEYPVSFTVNVSGILSVAEDTSKVPTVSVPWTAVVAALLHRMGATREHSVQILSEILPSVVGDNGFASVITEAEVKEIGLIALDAIKGSLPKTPVKGAVKADLVVTPVVVGD